MIQHTSKAVSSLLVLVFLVGMANAEPTKWENIPAEVLEHYNKDVVEGKRPRFVTITTPMIYSLVERPYQGGEIYLLDIEMKRLTKRQKEIFLEWVSEGRRILIQGTYRCTIYNTLFPGLSGYMNTGESWYLAGHPVNSGVKDLRFEDWGVFTTYPETLEVIASTKDGPIVGRIPYGRGHVYFYAADGWTGADVDRFRLNFYH